MILNPCFLYVSNMILNAYTALGKVIRATHISKYICLVKRIASKTGFIWYRNTYRQPTVYVVNVPRQQMPQNVAGFT